MVLMLTISCCGIRKVNYGGRKIKPKGKILRSTGKLVDRIIELTKSMDKEKIILVIGEANSGKSSFIRRLQSILRGSLENDEQGTDNNAEQNLFYKGRKLPIVLSEVTPHHYTADQTRQLGIKDFGADGVIFVIDSGGISAESLDELCNIYNPFTNFLRHNFVPFNVVIRKNIVEDASKHDTDYLSKCCSIFATSLENIFPLECYNMETQLIKERNVKLLQPLQAILEDIAVSVTTK